MIRPLRQRHRVIFCALALVLPLAFAAGVAARKPVPVMAALPSAVGGERPQFDSTIWERDDLWTQPPMRARLLAGKTNRLAVELIAARDIARADVIVYWVPGDPKLNDALPDNAVFLGAFTRNGPLPLPAEAAQQAGSLILYSLADHEIVARSKPLTF
ncbi:MAG: hypothetical protein HZA90_13070 [Verrucomicrobia bacterium]|nr:hypothetical protein [Verrucomicrobiota bacterium]